MIKKIIRKKMLFLLIITMAFSLSYLANAAAPTGPACTLSIPTEPMLQQQICDTWWNNGSGLFPIALIAVLLSFAIAALFYIAGTATKIESLRNFGHAELYEATATAIIVGLFFFIAGLILQTIPSYLVASLGAAGGAAPTVTVTDPYVVATGAIANTVNSIELQYDCILNGAVQAAANCPFATGEAVGKSTNYAFLASFVTQNVDLSFLGSVFPSSGSKVGGFLNAGLFITRLSIYIYYMVPQQVIGVYLIDGLYVLWGMYYLLLFFSYIGPLFVALGVIFRAFLPTRALGGMLISTGIAFYVVMPTLFAFLYSPAINPYSSSLNAPSCNGIAIPNTCSLFGSVLNILNGLWLPVIFYPILIIAITYTFINSLSGFIGASYQSGRIRAGFI